MGNDKKNASKAIAKATKKQKADAKITKKEKKKSKKISDAPPEDELEDLEAILDKVIGTTYIPDHANSRMPLVDEP